MPRQRSKRVVKMRHGFRRSFASCYELRWLVKNEISSPFIEERLRQELDIIKAVLKVSAKAQSGIYGICGDVVMVM